MKYKKDTFTLNTLITLAKLDFSSTFKLEKVFELRMPG